ncbi:MAG: DUF6798 domain-containing protein [Anaerolineales bacterium]
MKTNAKQANHNHLQNRGYAKTLVFVVVWTIIFSLAYAQSPLYTSNQNQYFLHGLAQAGLGNLSQDWLANTLDPTPVFSKLIELSWRLILWQPVFYLYFGLLAGVYLFSILGIVNQLWGLAASSSKRWLYLSILVVLHSAALRYLISQILGVNWDYLLDGGVAGQRLLGTVLQPSTFGVLLVLSIYLFLRRELIWAIVSLLAATIFHPTYLLSAAVLTAVYMGLYFWETRNLRATLALGLGAFVGVIPVLWQTYSTFGGTSPELTARAREILVTFRIPHHALVTDWFDASVIVKLFFVGLALILLFRYQSFETPHSEQAFTPARKLFHILLWPSVLAIFITLVQVITASDMLALLFPWRLSTWLVPLSVSLIAGWGVYSLSERLPLARYSRVLVTFCLIAALVFAAAGTLKFWISWQEKHNAIEQPMMTFVEAHQQPGEIYLIPTKMQDFRLETGAPAYVEFKSIPYQDVEVLEWYRRLLLANQFYARGSCDELPELAAEGITHLVLPAGHPAFACSTVELEYLDDNFGVVTLDK